jgi:hypothetical protein
VVLALGETVAAVEVVVRHRDRILVVRDDDVALPPPRTLDVRSHGLWLSIIDEGDGRWTVNLEAFALAVEHLDDELGDRVPLGLDVEIDGGVLFGELLVADEVVPVDEAAEWSVRAERPG